MQSDTDEAATVLWFTAALMALAAAVTVLNAWSLRRRVGQELAGERASRWARWAMLTVIVASAALAYVSQPDVPFVPTLVVLLLSAVVVSARPSTSDSIYGEHGVRRGWFARRFDQLEGWRLTGDHLRWKLAGEWLACRVPNEMQAALRAKLVAACPERESAFDK